MPYNINSVAHLEGKSQFIGDENYISNLHVAKCLLSKYAHARIKKLDYSKALEIEGVVCVITYKDIPGENQIGHVVKDEPLLPVDEVFYVGQPICIVVAKSSRIAELAISQIVIEYEELDKILTIDDAIKEQSFYIAPKVITRGELNKSFEESSFIIEDVLEIGGQEHFYMETQRCLSYRDDSGGIYVKSATQSVSEVQEVVAHVLGLKVSDVTVDVARLGGAFGGKERGATLWASITALTAYITNLPIRLVLNREEDMLATGKRHPFKIFYKVGFNSDGKILGLDVKLYSNGGYYTDLSIPILERAMMHIDNCYYIPNIKITGYACKTNIHPNTAFRGFGGPQGIFTIEYILNKIAHFLKKQVIEIQEHNFYKENDITPYGKVVEDFVVGKYFKKFVNSTKFKNLVAQINEENKHRKYKKLGYSIVPVKFGISFTATLLNQASSLVWLYTDGSVSVSHCGVEMGQGLNTKIANVVVKELGVTLDKVRVESTNSKRTANTSPTAASTGTDLNGNAVRLAVLQIKKRLLKFAEVYLKQKFNCEISKLKFLDNSVECNNGKYKISFAELVENAYLNRIDLGAHGFYKTPEIYFDKTKHQGNPFYYFAQGFGVSVVEVDTLTGNFELKKVLIYHDIGNSLDLNVDFGQISGAFVQGMGWCTFEEVIYDKNGKCLVLSPSVYKIPTISDIPDDFEINSIRKKAKKSSVLGSKGIGEPPLIYGLSVFFAIKYAIESIGNHEIDCKLKHPATAENVVFASEYLRNLIKNQLKQQEYDEILMR